jgi:hypothetical protein
MAAMGREREGTLDLKKLDKNHAVFPEFLRCWFLPYE